MLGQEFIYRLYSRRLRRQLAEGAVADDDEVALGCRYDRHVSRFMDVLQMLPKHPGMSQAAVAGREPIR